MRHILEINDLSSSERNRVLDLAATPDPARVLTGQGMALIFEKPSARTRNSMEMWDISHIMSLSIKIILIVSHKVFRKQPYNGAAFLGANNLKRERPIGYF